MSTLSELGARAKRAAKKLSQAGPAAKSAALEAMASALLEHEEEILAANREDLAAARESGMGAAMQDRLLLSPERLADIAASTRYVAGLNDPVGKILEGRTMPNGLVIEKITVPLGVVGVIFESRPNVTADCAALCLKSGNACILRGGKEAVRTNTAMVNAIRSALAATEIVPDCVLLVEDTSRETADEMMRSREFLDLLIPRGGKGLINAVCEKSTVPVIQTGAGNCHIFVDESAPPPAAVAIVENAKTSRPSVCNAVETLLVHKNCAARVLPPLAARLGQSGVELRGCDKTRRILGGLALPATDEDYATEFDDKILAIRVVDNLDDALEHIDRFSTRHSEAIVTNDYANARRFQNEVDSAAVYVNASTRFTDGGEFGLGAEIGISTQKLHARGPMGLSSLTSWKYLINGSGQIR